MHCPMCQMSHTDSTSQALNTLSSTPRYLSRIASRMSTRQAGAPPAPGKWSVKEIIAHLADCELVYGFRYRKLLSEPRSELAAFDQNAWAEGTSYRARNIKTTLDSFTALRRNNVSILKSLPQAAWARKSAHPEYGELSLRQLVLHLAEHDRKHSAQIERILDLQKPRPRAAAKRSIRTKKASP